LGVKGSQKALKSLGTSERGAGFIAATVFIGVYLQRRAYWRGQWRRRPRLSSCRYAPLDATQKGLSGGMGTTARSIRIRNPALTL
jgi:hypothetical protein